MLTHAAHRVAVSSCAVTTAPLVSVVMTTYNGAPFVAAQIDSILAQSYPHLELIISDDGSSDGTWEELERYRYDGRVTLLRNNGQRGLHANLEFALNHARGDFIAISDQDDIWRSDKLDVLMQGIGNNTAIYSNSALIDSNGSHLGMTLLDYLRVARPVCGRQYIRLVRANCVSGHSLLFRRSLLQFALPFNPGFMYDQQLAMLAMAASGLAFHPESLVMHRQHQDNQNNQLAIVQRYLDPTLPHKRELQAQKLAQKQRVMSSLQFAIERVALMRSCDKPTLGDQFSFRILCVILQRLQRDNDKRKRKRDPVMFFSLLLIGRNFFYVTKGDKSIVKRSLSFSKR